MKVTTVLYIFLFLFKCEQDKVIVDTVVNVHEEFIIELNNAPLFFPEEPFPNGDIFSTFNFAEFKGGDNENDLTNGKFTIYDSLKTQGRFLKIEEHKYYGNVFFKIYENSHRFFLAGWLEGFEEGNEGEVQFFPSNGYFVIDKVSKKIIFIGLKSSFVNHLKPEFNPDDILIILNLDCDLMVKDGFQVHQSKVISRSKFKYKDGLTEEAFELLNVVYHGNLRLDKITIQELSSIHQYLNPRSLKARAEIKGVLWYGFPRTYEPIRLN